MQSSYELVNNAIKFQAPSRIPYNFNINGEDIENDFLWVKVDRDEDFVARINGENELGVIYDNNDPAQKPVKHPLSDIRMQSRFLVPDFGKLCRYRKLEQEIKESDGNKYILGEWPHFLFHTCLDLCGFEGLMMSFCQNSQQLHELVKKLTDSCIKVVDRMAERGVQGMFALENLGVDNRLFINPPMWRKFFKPAYQRIFKHVHSKDMLVFMHSSGQIFDLLEDLIEAGLDVIQIDRQDHMGIDNLSDKYGGRICFFCPADIQTVLTVKDNFLNIEKRAKELIEKFGGFQGGFIAKTCPNPETLGIPIENMEYMCKMFVKYGSEHDVRQLRVEETNRFKVG